MSSFDFLNRIDSRRVITVVIDERLGDRLMEHIECQLKLSPGQNYITILIGDDQYELVHNKVNQMISTETAAKIIDFLCEEKRKIPSQVTIVHDSFQLLNKMNPIRNLWELLGSLILPLSQNYLYLNYFK